MATTPPPLLIVGTVGHCCRSRPSHPPYFVVTVATTVVHDFSIFRRYVSVLSRDADTFLLLPFQVFCRPFELFVVISPKILRLELLHGSWMDVSDFANVIWMLEFFIVGCPERAPSQPCPEVPRFLFLLYPLLPFPISMVSYFYRFTYLLFT